jgi:hypothetical protein
MTLKQFEKKTRATRTNGLSRGKATKSISFCHGRDHCLVPQFLCYTCNLNVETLLMKENLCEKKDCFPSLLIFRTHR